MYIFPEGLYVDVRIEERFVIWINKLNGEVRSDNENELVSALIRVYDGQMWYSTNTTDVNSIQKEIDNLATLAQKNMNIASDPMVQKFEVNRDRVIIYAGDKCAKNTKRRELLDILSYYEERCLKEEVSEVTSWNDVASASYTKVSFCSSKGADIEWDKQVFALEFGYSITIDNVTTYAGKLYKKHSMDELFGHEEEIKKELYKYLDFAKNAKNITPGSYTCVFSPFATSLFTHESFGHKSESDFMLNDKTMRDEWTMGKKVGSEKISIVDTGISANYGYQPYDDEGTKAKETWLMTEGVLTGRLHNAKSAAVLGEELTGNARSADASCQPIVRMTNTYMRPGRDDPDEMIKGIREGVYIEDIDRGTGNSNFSIIPRLCRMIRDGKICEAVRVNLITGNVFETLFEVDAVGNDFTEFETFWCGKNGQTISVGVGGPSIRVKRITLS